MRLARPTEPELEEPEAAQSEPEEAAPTTTGPEAAEVETANLYQGDTDDPLSANDEGTSQSPAPSQQTSDNDRTQN